MIKKILVGIFSLFLSLIVFAQDTAAVHNADRVPTGLRADGKIYVVMAVAVVILVGLFIYLIRIDNKLGRLEKGQKD
jgi:K+-transporting ATPase A subunit